MRIFQVVQESNVEEADWSGRQDFKRKEMEYELGHEKQFSQKPKMVGMYFYNVPADQEQTASVYGVNKTKSGKFALIKYDKSGKQFGYNKAKADSYFGPGKWWEPSKTEDAIEEGNWELKNAPGNLKRAAKATPGAVSNVASAGLTGLGAVAGGAVGGLSALKQGFKAGRAAVSGKGSAETPAWDKAWGGSPKNTSGAVAPAAQNQQAAPAAQNQQAAPAAQNQQAAPAKTVTPYKQAQQAISKLSPKAKQQLLVRLQNELGAPPATAPAQQATAPAQQAVSEQFKFESKFLGKMI